MGNTTMRERFLEDFGIDLPIAGGAGGRDTPVIVTAPTVQDAVDAQMRYLSCLGKGRHVAWRLLEQTPVPGKAAQVRAAIETVTLTETEVVRQREGFYFVFESLQAAQGGTARLPLPAGFDHARSGLRLPFQVEWVHLDGTTDYEAKQPGLGCSAAYNGAGIKATVYVYDRGDPTVPNDVRSERVVAEYQEAVRGALAVNEEHGVKLLNQGFAGGEAGPPKFALALLEIGETTTTAVLVTAKGGHFVKARLTWESGEDATNAMGQQTLQALMAAIHPE